ncbi:hypothetical protein [uncultured Maribacter sp.]|uniref:hypothetical protein n=1 Tax=uncultured Maribacter sp. TaxID=431308 RepID=UPI0026017178|nr:hypothetical protein [uncultured Maribacter sp.]
MGLLKCYKLKASSIAESIIAMVIIAVCLSIVMVVYVRVLHTDKNLQMYIAEQKVKELLWKTKNTNEFVSEDYSYPSFVISKEVEELSVDKDLFKIKFTVKSGGKQNKYEYIIAN